VPVAIRQPRVLWAFKAAEHFIAPPVAGQDALYVSGLGSFNAGVFEALALDPLARRRELWLLTAPELKLPVVSPPAIVDGKLFFGSGMHQTEGAVLHCVKAVNGRSLWQLPLAGELVHLEGSPIIAGNRLFIGGGNAGVLAVDFAHATIDGREHTLEEIDAVVERRWQEMQSQYEEDKRRDPDLAFPPNPDSLPKAKPKTLWNVGKGRWHVDATVCLAGDRLLVGSAYLDAEQQGERAVICLQAADGKVLWKTPVKYNPWAAPVVVNSFVLIAGSSVRLDPKQVTAASGEVAALDLQSGEIKWRRELPAGVVSRGAIARAGGSENSDLVIYTATDGKVRGFNVRNGDQIWAYDSGNPLFAGAVVAGDTVYAADLKAVVHALSVSDGARHWTLDLAREPAVQTPGMVYGTPLALDGRLYVATCNLSGGEARRLGAVVCLGDQ
jgi:outer membrane protein assembly factor BamB